MSPTPNDAVKSGEEDLKKTAEDAKHQLRQEAERAKRAGADYARQAKDEVAARAEGGKNKMAGEVSRFAGALHEAAGNLEDDSIQAQILHRAAAGVDEAAATLKEKSVGDMAASVASFGRRNPAVFLGGAALLGFAFARFASASASHDHHRSSGRTPGRSPEFDAYAAGRRARPGWPESGEGLASRTAGQSATNKPLGATANPTSPVGDTVRSTPPRGGTH